MAANTIEDSRLRLIVTADDFGLARAVNEAVEQAHRTGILTSASLMVAAPAAADAIDRARRLPTLRVGLHVVVVDGQPMLPVDRIPLLTDARGQLSARLFRAGVQYFFRPSVRRQLRDEIRAQFEAYRRTGLPLDHVDTHRHMILHPTVLSAIIECATEFGVRAVRLPAEPFRATRGLPVSYRFAAAARIGLLTPWVSLMRRRLRDAGLRHNSEVRGLADTGRMTETTVLRLISTVDADATEIFFHPATTSPTPTPLPGPVAAHVAELDALCSARVRGALDRAHVLMIGLGDI